MIRPLTFSLLEPDPCWPLPRPWVEVGGEIRGAGVVELAAEVDADAPDVVAWPQFRWNSVDGVLCWGERGCQRGSPPHARQWRWHRFSAATMAAAAVAADVAVEPGHWQKWVPRAPRGRENGKVRGGNAAWWQSDDASADSLIVVVQAAPGEGVVEVDAKGSRMWKGVLPMVWPLFFPMRICFCCCCCWRRRWGGAGAFSFAWRTWHSCLAHSNLFRVREAQDKGFPFLSLHSMKSDGGPRTSQKTFVNENNINIENNNIEWRGIFVSVEEKAVENFLIIDESSRRSSTHEVSRSL